MEDIQDIYIKGPNEPNYNSTKLTNNSKLDVIVSKIYMILFTNKGDVLGDPNFGADIPKYLWKTSFPASTIQDNIVEQIQDYVPELTSNDYNVNVYILPGSHKDIGVVNVDIGVDSVNALFR